MPDKSRADDFGAIAPQIDSLTRQHGTIRLLIDASGFHGWKSVAAFETHAGFVKDHQQIERIAVIATHDWQHWLIGAFRIFVHPDARASELSQEREARRWIVAPQVSAERDETNGK